MASDCTRLQKKVITPHTISDEGRELLEKYAGIPSHKIEEHVISVRNRAWDVWPYVCIGEARFLDLYMSRFPEYPSILERLKQNKDEILLDLGCCFGQDLRKLVFDGAPLESLYGAELRPEFLELSYELFQDAEKLKPRLVTGNIFDIPNTGLAGLANKIDIIYASAFIHLFDWDGQVACCIGIVNILKPKKGSIVFGRQAGRSEPVWARNLRDQDDNKMIYIHSTASFTKLWDYVGEKTNSRWKVTARLIPTRDLELQKHVSGHGRLYFSVERQ